jgi:hypothetical protein
MNSYQSGTVNAFGPSGYGTAYYSGSVTQNVPFSIPTTTSLEWCKTRFTTNSKSVITNWAVEGNTCISSQTVSREQSNLQPGETPLKYGKILNEAVSTLARKNAAHFKKMLSATTISREPRGAGAVDQIIEERFIPFFKGFSQLNPGNEAIPTYNAEGATGFALPRSFVNADGLERHFVMYIIEEKGSLKVGNLLLDKTIDDLRTN